MARLVLSNCVLALVVIAALSLNSAAALIAPTAAAAGYSSKPAFLTSASLAKASALIPTPFYAYDAKSLIGSADKALAFPNAYGLTVRYAMKSAPTKALVQIFNSKGIQIDASSVFEVERAMLYGVPGPNISLSTQELPNDLPLIEKILGHGVQINACSMNQIETLGKVYEKMGGTKEKLIGVRVNPGVGSGGFSGSTMGFSKTNVGGPSSSFGIWHEDFNSGAVKALTTKYGLNVERIHTHIGSGSDPEIWKKVALKSLSFCEMFPTVNTLNLGGGFKVARNPGEVSTDLQSVGGPVKEAFVEFFEKTKRELKLEIEPGTFLVGAAGAVVSKVQDIVTTSGPDGHIFLKLDSGMTEIMRPQLYGAPHPMCIVKKDGSESTAMESVVVVGHCCESGDLLTPLPGQPESLGERELVKADIGDYFVIDGAGAYCSGMSTKNYNSFPESGEVLVHMNGDVSVIRERQNLHQIFQNEVTIGIDTLLQ
jgi:diaminopimelate decarboxylase